MSCIFIPLNRLVLYFLFSVLLSSYLRFANHHICDGLAPSGFFASRLIYSYSYTYCVILYSRCLRYLSQIWGSARQRKSTVLSIPSEQGVTCSSSTEATKANGTHGRNSAFALLPGSNPAFSPCSVLILYNNLHSAIIDSFCNIRPSV
ncbi:hypothetical protein ASPVEDRAFT_672388 [Aspergillus versicolor CBS 583.65]|uniref:Uncharacterized protein n=1 Tax=Aspergillus versicolor CBS 583.65 TaxID=1036611 RepID=A0A1L9PLL9_ASPVE|nr:uncharacterized protein ASPVEDRAFT_672388 [Aspergillus versicolor CBS 583.65]OJJ02420.1 hypothetical protein ASPVEDRAFT_672388 [Aspergillus versicolor CBS 583.65]